MRLPVKEDGSIDEERATKQIRHAIDNGVNYVDTAWPYHNGESEPFLGRALADGYREQVKIATKLPSWLVKSREDMDMYLNAQLEKLQTKQIEYYLVHSLAGDEWDRIEKLGIREFFDEAKADGRIKHAGFSFHGHGSDFSRIIDGYDWNFCQIQYNYLDEKNQAGTAGLEYAASKGLAVMIMEPLRGGNLAKTVPPEVKEIWDQAKTKRTPAEWALRWVWNHPEVTVVLSGMNEESHVEENLRVAGGAHPNSMSGEELQLISQVEKKYRELMKVSCTGCRYCMPCPSGVNIPYCFEVYNNKYFSGKPEEAELQYVLRLSGIMTSGEPGFASQCIQCEQCLDKCPQHIDIPTVLATVAEEMEGDDLEQKIATARELFEKSG